MKEKKIMFSFRDVADNLEYQLLMTRLLRELDRNRFLENINISEIKEFIKF